MVKRSKTYPDISIVQKIRLIARGMSLPFLIFVSLGVGSALVFSQLEGWSVTEAVYFAIVTIATVGYGDLQPSTPESQLAAMGLIVGGIAGVAFATRYFVEYTISTRDQEFRDQLIMARLKNHIIFVGMNEHLVATARLFERIGVPSIFVLEGGEATEGAESEFICVQSHQFILETLRGVSVNNAAGIVVDTETEEGVLISLLSLREELPELKVVVITDDPEVATLFSNARNASFLLKPFLVGLKIRSELSGLRIIEQFSIKLPGALEIRELTLNSPELAREANTLELNGLSVLGFTTNAFNEFIPRSEWDKKKVRSNLSSLRMVEGRFLVVGPREKFEEFLQFQHGTHKSFSSTLLVTDADVSSFSLFDVEGIRQATNHLTIFFTYHTDDLPKTTKVLRWMSGIFSTAFNKESMKGFDLVLVLTQSPTRSLGLVHHIRQLNPKAKIWCRNPNPQAQALFYHSGADFVFSSQDTIADGIMKEFFLGHTYSNKLLFAPPLNVGYFGTRISKFSKTYRKSQVVAVWRSEEGGEVEFTTQVSKRRRVGRNEQVLLLIDR